MKPHRLIRSEGNFRSDRLERLRIVTQCQLHGPRVASNPLRWRQLALSASGAPGSSLAPDRPCAWAHGTPTMPSGGAGPCQPTQLPAIPDLTWREGHRDWQSGTVTGVAGLRSIVSLGLGCHCPPAAGGPARVGLRALRVVH
jgi:hypothetical protein